MANFFNRIGQIGLGLALVGSAANSALYNGLYTQIINIVIQSTEILIRIFPFRSATCFRNKIYQ